MAPMNKLALTHIKIAQHYITHAVTIKWDRSQQTTHKYFIADVPTVITPEFMHAKPNEMPHLRKSEKLGRQASYLYNVECYISANRDVVFLE